MKKKIKPRSCPLIHTKIPKYYLKDEKQIVTTFHYTKRFYKYLIWFFLNAGNELKDWWSAFFIYIDIFYCVK